MASYHINMSDLSSNPELASLSMLHVAAVNGDKSTIEILLKRSELDDYKCDVNECDKYGRTALVYTIFGDWYDCAELLLRNGATVSKEDRDKRTPLHWAAYLGKPKFVSLLLRRMDKSQDWNKGDLDGRTSLHYAAAHRSAKCLRLLLKYAPPGTLDITDREKKTALHWSVYYGNFEQVKLLKDARAKVHLRDAKWNSFLHLAVANASPDSVRIVRYLLKINRFYSTQKDCEGRTPLHLAVANENEILVKELSMAPISALDELDNLSRSALHYAVLRNNVTIVNTLILNGVSLYKEDNAGATPLHYAAKNNSVAVLERFLSYEKLEDLPDKQGRTALMWAASEGSDNVLDLMLKNTRCFDIDARDKEGLTALHFACISGHLACVMKLITNSADVRQPDKLGQTALYKACQQGHVNIADFLMNNELFYLGNFPNSSRGLSVTIVDEQEREGSAKECDRTSEGESHYASHSGKDDVTKTGGLSATNSNSRKIEIDPKTNRECDSNSHEKSATGKMKAPGSRLAINRKECIRNLEDCNGCTPLHFAAHSGHMDVCKWLLDNGVDPEKKDVSGRTALHGAAFNGHITCMALMLSHCAKLKNDRDNNGYCALHRAAVNGHLEAVKMLVLEHKAFANYRVKSSNLTPLDLAMAANQQDVTQFLIDHGGLTIAGVEEVASDTIKRYLREWIITRKKTTLKPLLEKHKMLTRDLSVKNMIKYMGTTEGDSSKIFNECAQLNDDTWCSEDDTGGLQFKSIGQFNVDITGGSADGTTATNDDSHSTITTTAIIIDSDDTTTTTIKHDSDANTTTNRDSEFTTTNVDSDVTTTTTIIDSEATTPTTNGDSECTTNTKDNSDATTSNGDTESTTATKLDSDASNITTNDNSEFTTTTNGDSKCTTTTTEDDSNGTITTTKGNSDTTTATTNTSSNATTTTKDDSDRTVTTISTKSNTNRSTNVEDRGDTTTGGVCDSTTTKEDGHTSITEEYREESTSNQELDGTAIARDCTMVDNKCDRGTIKENDNATTANQTINVTCKLVDEKCDCMTIDQKGNGDTKELLGATMDQDGSRDGSTIDQRREGSTVDSERDGPSFSQGGDGTAIDAEYDGASVNHHDGTTVDQDDNGTTTVEPVGDSIGKEPQQRHQNNNAIVNLQSQQHVQGECLARGTQQQNLKLTEKAGMKKDGMNADIIDGDQVQNNIPLATRKDLSKSHYKEHQVDNQISELRNDYTGKKCDREGDGGEPSGDGHFDKQIEKQLPEYHSSTQSNDCIIKSVKNQAVALNERTLVTNSEEQLTVGEDRAMPSFKQLLPLYEVFYQDLLFDSCRQGSWDAIDDFLDVNLRDENGCTLLHLAAGQGSEVICRRLVELGADTGKRDIHGQTAFHHAALSGHSKCAVVFLERNPDLLKAVDCDNKTGLHWAAANGYLEVVRLLVLKYNALMEYPQAANNTNLNGLDYTTLGHNESVVRFLTEHEAQTSGLLDSTAHTTPTLEGMNQSDGFVIQSAKSLPKPDPSEVISADSFDSLFENSETHSVSWESRLNSVCSMESCGNVVVGQLKHLPKPPSKERPSKASNVVKKYSRAPDHVVAASEKEKIFKLRRDWERIAAVRRKVKAAIIIQRCFREYLQRRGAGEIINFRKPDGDDTGRPSKSSKKATLPGKTRPVKKQDCLADSEFSPKQTTSRDQRKSCFPTLSQSTSADSTTQSRSRHHSESLSPRNNLHYRSALTTNEMVEEWLQKGTLGNESRGSLAMRKQGRWRTQSEKDQEMKFYDEYYHSLPDGSYRGHGRSKSYQDPRQRPASSAQQRHLSRETLLRNVYASPAAVSYNFALDTYHPLASRRGCKQPSFPFKTSTRVRPNSMKRGINGWVHTTKPAPCQPQPSSDSAYNSR